MILRTFVALAAASVFAAAGAATPPASVKADYAVYKDGLQVGMMQESFATNAGKYQITSDTNPVGLAAMFVRTRIKAQGSGTVTAAGLQPERMEYGRLDDASKNVSAAFDWRARELHLTFDGRNETLPLGNGTQDRVSVMYKFMFLAPEKLKVLEFPMTNGKKIERYRYELTGREQIDTPLGKLDALHLVKHRERDENRVEVWLAADRRLFPVKLLILENDGSRLEQIITRLDIK